MIHDVLPSDVDLAGGMLNASHSDAEILAYLASRAIDPAKATQVRQDVRHGRAPGVQLPQELLAGSDGLPGHQRAAQEHTPHKRHSHRRRSHRGRRDRYVVPWWFIILLAIALLALGYLTYTAGSRLSTNAMDQYKHEVPPDAGK